MQIIVLGSHRSGTSLVTRLINMMGAYCFGEDLSIGASEENPKGFWERRDVVETNEELLNAMGASWDHPLAWCPESAPEEVRERFQKRFLDILLNLDAHRPWVIKDPRLCLTFPLLRPLLEVPVLVYVYRCPLEVAASLKKRNGLTLPYGLALWEFYAVHALNGGEGLPAIYVRYHDFISRPLEAVEELYQKLSHAGIQGLRLPTKREILAFIQPDLWRQRWQEQESHLTDYQRKIAEALQGNRPPKQPLQPSPLTIELLKAELKSRQERERSTYLQTRLQDMEQQRNQLQTRLQETEHAVKQLEPIIDSTFALIKGNAPNSLSALAKLNFIARHIGHFVHQQNLLRQDIQFLENLVLSYQQMVHAIFHSKSWRWSSKTAAFLGRILRKPPSRLPEDAQRLAQQFMHWRQTRG